MVSSVGVEPTFPPSEGGVLSVIRRGRFIPYKKPGDPLRYSFVRRHRGPGFSGALGRNRTYDLLDRNQTLYPLSYKRKRLCFLHQLIDSENKVKYAGIFRECQSCSGHGVLRGGVHKESDGQWPDQDRQAAHARGRRAGLGCEVRAIRRVEHRYE